LIDAEFGGRLQARRGQLIDTFGDAGVAAQWQGRMLGLACWKREPADRAVAEVTCLVVAAGQRGRGIGRALLDGAVADLEADGVERIWLVTTNDNLVALRLYQQAGFRLTALRAGAIDAARRTLKPSIGEIGEHGIPIRDELELERQLDVD
jgi:ribosomal protein S18 acetylase RimI-like enzyme